MPISAILPNANEVSNHVLIPSAEYAASDVTAPFNADRFDSGQIIIICSAITAGTLDLYLQQLLPDGTYGDFAASTQIAAASKVWINFKHGVANSVSVIADGALAAGTILNVNQGASWRIKFVIVTGPVTFGVWINAKTAARA